MANLLADRLESVKLSLEPEKRFSADDFRVAALCSSLALTPQDDLEQSEKEVLHRLDVLSLRDFLSTLQPDDSWTTMTVALKHLKLCRGLVQIILSRLDHKVSFAGSIASINELLSQVCSYDVNNMADDSSDDKEMTIRKPKSARRAHDDRDDQSGYNRGLRGRKGSKKSMRGGRDYQDYSEKSSTASQQTLSDDAQTLKEDRKGRASLDGDLSKEKSCPKEKISKSLSEASAEEDGGCYLSRQEDESDDAEREVAYSPEQSDEENKTGDTFSIGSETSPSEKSTEVDEEEAVEQMSRLLKGKKTVAGITSIMLNFPSVEQVQVKGAKFIAEHLQSRSLEKHIDSFNLKKEVPAVIGAVCAAMQNFPQNTGLQLDCFRICQNYAAKNDRNLAKLIAIEGFTPLMHAMTALPRNEEIQTLAVGLLGNPVINDPSILRISALSQRLVISSMKRFPANSKIQGLGCLALGNLANRNAESAADIVKRGGASLILHAMKKYAYDSSVQGAGCWALEILATQNVETRNTLRNLGTVQVCNQTLKNFSVSSAKFEGLKKSASAIVEILIEEEEEESELYASSDSSSSSVQDGECLLQ